LYFTDPQSGQKERQDVSNGLRTATPDGAAFRKAFHERNGFPRALLRRQLGDGRTPIGHHLLGRSVMLLVEGDQLVEDVGSRRKAAMAHELPADQDEEGQTAEARGDLDMVVPRVFALGLPAIGPSWELVIALEQVVGDSQKRRPEAAVGTAVQPDNWQEPASTDFQAGGSGSATIPTSRWPG
jgi:hypothetical protein